MKVIALCICITVSSVAAIAQQSHRKLTNEESAKMTQEQRLVYENDRKSKNGKRTLSLKKKERINRKQQRKSERIRTPKRKNDSLILSVKPDQDLRSSPQHPPHQYLGVLANQPDHF